MRVSTIAGLFTAAAITGLLTSCSINPQVSSRMPSYQVKPLPQGIPRPFENSPSVVTIEKGTGKKRFQLVRNGQPYYVKGIGGWQQLEFLIASGGNSFRTWGAPSLELMDQAAALGITVTAGLWIQHERHGADYNDKAWVESEFQRFKKSVIELKDHPALLMWAIGNEVQIGYENPKVWNFINRVSKMIHSVDGNHPTSTITPWPSERVMKDILERAPDLDVLGLNSYAGLAPSLSQGQKLGWNGPTLVTEYGPNGHWEVGKTSWGAYIEENSTQKAGFYGRRTWLIADDPDCLGGYAFLWGEKQERTATWYGLIFNGNEITAGVDELTHAWTGAYPEDRAPVVNTLKINDHSFANDNVVLKAGSENTAFLDATDSVDLKNLFYRWELRHETTAQSGGGDEESIPAKVEGVISEVNSDGSVVFTAPEKPGQYRLFAYVYDSIGKLGHANIPFVTN